jgi:hypothetical protein
MKTGLLAADFRGSLIRWAVVVCSVPGNATTIRAVSAITLSGKLPGTDHIRPSSRLAARKNSVVKVAGRYENEFKKCPRFKPGAFYRTPGAGVSVAGRMRRRL